MLTTALQWGKLVVILATPYFFAGMAISLALTRSPWPVPLVYGVDLVGAAAGCLVVLAVLTLVNSVSAWFLVGAFGAARGADVAQARRGMKQVEAPLPAIARSPHSRTTVDFCRRVCLPRDRKRCDPALRF